MKARHEATIVGGKAIQSKGGSIRYMLEGEYDGRKTLPKTVSKADFESVYGFDAKEAEAVIITGKEAIGMGKKDVVKGFIKGKEDKDDFTPNQIITFPHEIGTANLENHADTVGSPSPADVQPPAPSDTPFPQEPSNENFSAETEVKEAFGLFGKKDEEESDEPKTKEYTVVLQEGDKLELTDLPGDDPEKNEEDKDESEEKDEKEGETYEAVQAKVTRIEDEKEEEDEEESDEGLLTPKNLAIGALGVGALALALGAEDDESDYWADEGQYTMNAEGLYESSSVSGDVDVGESKRVMGRKDYDISTDYDGDLEIDDIDLDVPEVFEEYEDELIQAVKDDVDYSMPIEDGETGTGSYDVDVEVELPVRVTGSVDFNWTSDLEDEDDHTDDEWASEEVSEIEYDEYLDELGSDALTLYKDNPSQLFEKAYPIDYEVGMNDYESSLLADIQSGYTENSMLFDEDENLTPYGEKVLKEMYDDLIDQMGIEWLADRHPPSELLKRGDPIAYRVGMSEYEDAFESESDGYTYAYTKGHKDGMKDEIVYRPSIDTDREKTVFKKILKQKADTVGSPSPSGPSSVPEPAEATGSEPSNENFESQDTGNLKLIGGIGLVAAGLFALGKSDWVADMLDKYMK